MTRTTLTASLLATAALAGAAVAATSASATQQGALPSVPSAISVVTIEPNPPFEIRKNGKLTGFDVQLVNQLARMSGINKVSWTVAQNLPTAFQMVSSGQVPVQASSLTITAQRAKSVAFGNPYMNADYAVVTRKGMNWGKGGNLTNLTVGVLKGSTAAEYVQDLPGNVVEVVYPTMTGAYQALLRGAVKTVVNDYAQSDWYVQANQPKFALNAVIPSTGKLALAFTKNHVALRKAFNKALAVMQKNGSLLRLKNQWIP